MSKKSEQQFEGIVEKPDKLLEENIKLKQQIAQKDDELALQKNKLIISCKNYLVEKRNLLWILTR